MNKTQRAISMLTWILCQKTTLGSTPCEGVRLGIQAGYGIIEGNLQNKQLFNTPQTSDTSSMSGHGAIGGVNIDWNTLIGHSDTLVGLEASFNWLSAKGKKSAQAVSLSAGGLGNNDLSTTVLLKRSFDFTVRIGYLAKGAALGYIKLGPSLSHWKASSVSNSFPAKGGIGINLFGVIVGIGAEFPISDRFSFGAEYNYRRYKDYGHKLDGSVPPSILDITMKPASHAIMLRLNYKVSALDFTTNVPAKERKRKRIKKPK